MSAGLPVTMRVNSAMLSSSVGKYVRFVGKILEQNGEKALLIASDNGQVEVHMNNESQYGTQYIEVIGVVREDLSIEEQASTNFGNEFGKGS
ncbi:hypothetical protein BGZ76_003439 [Entomortierella beljakovae]|nr:hypothetical protein BGZ76_003439 [Entomortierella beljakovae]